MTLRIGTGAGFSADRIAPAVDLAQRGALDYLIFECLAERTIAKAQQSRMSNGSAGYDPFLIERMRAVLPACCANNTTIISNMGAANPLAAGETIVALCRELGLMNIRIAVVQGDDVLSYVTEQNSELPELRCQVRKLGPQVVSANAYLGATPLLEALKMNANIIIAGRVADPAMFLAPLVHEFNWSMDDCDKLGQGTVVGHLMECGAQVSGGYFADPGVKTVPDIAQLGFPIAEVEADGSVVITKLDDTGGCVTEATCKEQLLYEIHDPARYFQPDVIADFNLVAITADGLDRVHVSGGRGSRRSGQLKVSLAYFDSWVGEGQISYAGANAVARGKLALQILDERLKLQEETALEVRTELIGVDSIFGDCRNSSVDNNNERNRQAAEVRLRFVARYKKQASAQALCHEIESLYLNGPAGGGGVYTQSREILAITSLLIPEESVSTSVTLLES